MASDARVLSLSVPGKTFLVGEYVALDGGPSILLSTAPRFELKAIPLEADRKTGYPIAKKKNQSSRSDADSVSGFDSDSDSGVRPPGRSPFHPQSPAGLFLGRHPELLKTYRFEFVDPHQGKGGLGASSAQFLLLYALAKGVRSVRPEAFDWKELLAEYRMVAWNGEGTPPSGADVVSQMCGQLTWFDGREFLAQRLNWAFPNLSFTLLRTGAKLATHEHLRKPQAAPHDALRRWVAEATKAFEACDESALIAAVNGTAATLRDAGLTAENTLSLLERLRAQSGLVFAAKGCGAMGADVVLVMHERGSSELLQQWARAEGLGICGSRESLSAGLEVVG